MFTRLFTFHFSLLKIQKVIVTSLDFHLSIILVLILSSIPFPFYPSSNTYFYTSVFRKILFYLS